MSRRANAAAVFARLTEFLDTHRAVDPTYRMALEAAAERANGAMCFLPIDIPMAVGTTIGLAREVQVSIAACCTSLWIGADLLDDIADRELAPVWQDVPETRLTLMAINYLATFPHLLTGDPTLSRATAEALYLMSEGQRADLAEPSDSVEAYGELIRRKSGAELALFASLPARAAGADGPTVAAWHDFGESYGCMVQIYTDVRSAFAKTPPNDLRNGKHTLPVICARARLDDDARRAFERDLTDAACGDEEARFRAMGRMSDCGAARFSLERAELFRHRAAAALPVALGELAIDHPLRWVLRQYSVI